MPTKKRSTSGRPYRRARERVVREQRVCHLCGLPIDPELRAPHPMSASAHHDPPVSHAGERGPLVAAHLGCNRARGNRGAPPPEERSDKW